MTGATEPQVHAPDGFTSSGSRSVAWCSCGWSTTPRVDDARARTALERQHALSEPVCRLCGRERPGFDPVSRGGRFTHLRVFTWEGDQWLACADDEQTCRDLARQRQLHLDKAVFDSLGLDLPAPQLRVLGRDRP